MPIDDTDTAAILARLDERTERMAEDVTQLKHTLLEGNGVPAVTVQLATLNEKVAVLQKEKAEERVPRHVWVSIFFSIIAVLLAAYLGAGKSIP